MQWGLRASEEKPPISKTNQSEEYCEICDSQSPFIVIKK